LRISAHITLELAIKKPGKHEFVTSGRVNENSVESEIRKS